MQSSLLAVRWQPRQLPLTPTAVAAFGSAALQLAQKLLAQSQSEEGPESLAKFEGVAGEQLLVLQSRIAEARNSDDSGTNIELPWVDGVQYLGSDPAAPLLLLPTNYQPVLPGEILEKVFQARGLRGEKLAVLLQPRLLVPMAEARAVSRAVLASWLAEQKS